MSDKPYLPDEQILEIVKPLKQPAAIVRWFRSHGFPNCKVRPSGLPLIYRSEFESCPQTNMNGGQEKQPEAPDVTGFLQGIANRSKNRAPA